LVRRSFPLITYNPHDLSVWEEAFQQFSSLTSV
jgi:hypothetical protein